MVHHKQLSNNILPYNEGFEGKKTGYRACLSAIKGVNQAFARFTPFFTPKNAIRTKLGSGNIPFIGYFVITTLIQTKYPQKISKNNYNKN